MPFIFIPPHVRFVEIIIDHKLIIFNWLQDTFVFEEHEMIKMCARLLELLNGVIEAAPILLFVSTEYL
ncbi:hypothetical protein C3400_25200 [Klebsiella oxytoca]|nr:hypothetical protein C3412_24570 [Klebsiella oxytoca]POT84431.1 hypothetical protein C3416_24420 [Klebsiella oxytoca]POU91901.1 hypothetical protein C3400_25200 [Klebsiella oxytoca]